MITQEDTLEHDLFRARKQIGDIIRKYRVGLFNSFDPPEDESHPLTNAKLVGAIEASGELYELITGDKQHNLEGEKHDNSTCCGSDRPF